MLPDRGGDFSPCVNFPPISLELTVTASSSGSTWSRSLNDRENSDPFRFWYSSTLASDEVSERLGPSYSTLMWTRSVILLPPKLLPERIDAAEDIGRSSTPA